MNDGSSGATVLLGMDGFAVLAMIEEDGELFISVETTADVVGCRCSLSGLRTRQRMCHKSPTLRVTLRRCRAHESSYYVYLDEDQIHFRE